MTRKHSDAVETPDSFGPLFQLKPRARYSPDDPATSRHAAERAAESGLVGKDQDLLVSLVERHPGQTMEDHGIEAARIYGGDPFRWRIKLGRRTGELISGRRIHSLGERDGKSLWWPGSNPDAL